MGTIIIVAVAVVLLALTVVVGLAAALGRQHISEDYFVAGRSLPWYVVACSVAGLSLRLEMWLGLLGLTCVAGVAAGGLAWGSFIGLTVLSGVFLPYFVRKKISSPAEFLERRYSPATRGLFALLSILFLVLGVLVPALYVGGWVLSEAGFHVPLSTANGIPWVFFACVAAIALVSSLAGVIGGSMAGAWGGALQFLLVAIGGTVFAVVATRDAGGLASIWENRTWREPRCSVVASWRAALGRHDCLRAFDRVLEHGRQSVDGAALPGGAQRVGCAPGRDRGRPAAARLAGGICLAGPGGGGETRLRWAIAAFRGKRKRAACD